MYPSMDRMDFWGNLAFFPPLTIYQSTFNNDVCVIQSPVDTRIAVQDGRGTYSQSNDRKVESGIVLTGI